VWSVALYAAETWTLTQADSDRIKALHSRNVDLAKNGKDKLDKVTNEDVLKKGNESKNMLNVIRQRKRKWIGHVLRHDEFLYKKFLKEE